MTEKKRSHENKGKRKRKPVTANQRLLSMAQAAEIMGVGTWRVAELVRQKFLPRVGMGKRQIRIDRIVLEKFIAYGGTDMPAQLAQPSPQAALTGSVDATA
jgi:excisionase family DNA binding protein